MWSATAAGDVMPARSRLTVFVAPYCEIRLFTTAMGTWLMFITPVCRCVPAEALYSASKMVLFEISRWMERVQKRISGGRVASCPFQKSTLPLFANAGLICGGSGYGGRPLSQLNAGVIPWSGAVKAYCPLKPEEWLVPETTVTQL